MEREDIIKELERKYLSIYPYIEEDFEKKVVLLSETYILFDCIDRERFLEYLLPLFENNLLCHPERVVGNIINSYFLGSIGTKQKIITLSFFIPAIRNLIKFLKLFLYDHDAIARQFVETKLIEYLQNRPNVFSQIIDKDILLLVSSDFCKKIEALLNCELQFDFSETNSMVSVEDVYEEVLFLIPPLLQREGFLQPPIDAVNAAAVFMNNDTTVKILDLRVEKKRIDSFKIHSKRIYVCMCPYDLMQNYPVDYKYEHAIQLTNYLAENNGSCDLYAYGPYFSINCSAITKLLNPTVRVLLGEIEEEILKIYNYKSSALTYDCEFLMPAYELIDLNKYYSSSNSKDGVISPWCAVLANRGCPFECSFCYLFFEHRLRMRDAKWVVEELKFLQNKNVKEVFFIDSTFTANKNWINLFCELYAKNNLTIKWQAETRIDCIDKNVAEQLKLHGCSKLWLGLESFNDKLLALANKRITAEFIITQLNEIKKTNLEIGAFFVAGLPGETKENLKELVRMADNMELFDIQFVMFTPRPKTKFYELAVSQYPFLDEDFRYLQIARGIVSNKIRRSEIFEILYNEN